MFPQGGFMATAFEYIKRNGGLMYSKDYELGEFRYPCKFTIYKSEIEVVDYFFIPSGDEELMKDALASIGPIAIAIDGNNDPFFSYGGVKIVLSLNKSSMFMQISFKGVFNSSVCDATNINHAVLLIGYGTDPGTDPLVIEDFEFF